MNGVARWVTAQLAAARARFEWVERPSRSVWTRVFGRRLNRRARQPVLLALSVPVIVGVLVLLGTTLLEALVPRGAILTVLFGTAAIFPSALGSHQPSVGVGGIFPSVSIGGGTTPPAAGLNLFNVKDYGARGDGVDDTVALKGCLNAIRTAGGGIMWFPPGTFVTSAQLYVPSNTIIQGASRQACVVKRKSNSIANGDANNTAAVFMAGPQDGQLYTVGAHGSSISFENITVDGNAAGNPGVTNSNLGCHGIRIHFVDFVRNHNVEMLNCLDSGIYIWGCRRSATFGCIARSNGQIGVASSRNGFHVTGPQDDATDRGAQDEHLFIGCIGQNNTDEGMAIGRAGQIAVIGCTFHDNGDMGIEGDSGTATADAVSVPAGWTISGCHIFNNGAYGIGLGNSNVQRCAVIGNVIEDNAGPGVSASFTSGSLVTVANNVIRNFGTRSVNDHAIIIGGADRAVITGNVIDAGAGTLASGIVLIAQTTVRHVNIGNNLISMAAGGQWNISIAGKATGRIGNNTCIGTAAAFTDGVNVNGGANGVDNLDICENYFSGAARDGIQVRTSAAGNVTNIRVRNNTSVSNGAYGFTCSEAGGGTVTGLYLSNNDFEGNATGRVNITNAAGASGRYRSATVALALGANVATDLAAGDTFTLTDNAVGTARTMTNPTNMLDDHRLTYRISNTSGGALGVLTWGANFKLAGAWVQPATGQSRTITFVVQGGALREESRAAADQPN
ncbi:MAG TPA: glycosyl hydrolase family 28-related protein [Kofleriaceae bacterium]|jgi:hypothetical protein